jgi:hypothetical protein
MSGTNTRPDSIYTWTFRASSGATWGGTLVADSDLYDAGAIVTTEFGRYVIAAEQLQGMDLTGFGMEDGEVYVEWYRDAAGQWLVTRNGGSTASGTGGLGTEQDAAWNGSAWQDFGLGGAGQPNYADPPDSRYDWRFVSDAGDTIWGSLVQDTGRHAVGDTIRTAFGTYTFTAEAPQGRDLGAEVPEGTVTITRYREADTAQDLRLENGGATPAGTDGLGSEFDRVQLGDAWIPVGLGGALQADPPAPPMPLFRARRDFGGDGKSDILWRGQAGEAVIWSIDGSSVTGGGWLANLGTYWNVAGTGDFDGNGKADILWRGQGAEVVIWQIDGNSVVGGGWLDSPGGYWGIAGTADFNADGKSDILWRGQGGEAVIWLLDGAGVIGGGWLTNLGSYWNVAATGDFDGNGKADILWRGQGAEAVIWQIDGNSVVGGGWLNSPGAYWTIAAAADFNADGKSDILWRGQGGETVIWLIDGTSVIGGGWLANLGTYWNIASTGDYDGNGKADILWRGQGAEAVIWLIDGSSVVGGGWLNSPGGYWSVIA